jgi:hypothetical protein
MTETCMIEFQNPRLVVQMTIVAPNSADLGGMSRKALARTGYPESSADGINSDRTTQSHASVFAYGSNRLADKQRTSHTATTTSKFCRRLPTTREDNTAQQHPRCTHRQQQPRGPTFALTGSSGFLAYTRHSTIPARLWLIIVVHYTIQLSHRPPTHPRRLAENIYFDVFPQDSIPTLRLQSLFRRQLQAGQSSTLCSTHAGYLRGIHQGRRSRLEKCRG